jgi:type II secretory pathway pseudopilin PulG
VDLFADFSGKDQTGGFSLIELLFALCILACGLLAAGQMIYAAVASSSLARTKTTAAIVADDKVEDLADLYRRDRGAPLLALGTHGPEVAEIRNPHSGAVLNRYEVRWEISSVPDPRPGRLLSGRIVTVTATPVTITGDSNIRTPWNQVTSVTGLLSPRVEQ